MIKCTQEEFYNFLGEQREGFKINICVISEPPTMGMYHPVSGELLCCCNIFTDNKYYTDVITDYEMSRIKPRLLEHNWRKPK